MMVKRNVQYRRLNTEEEDTELTNLNPSTSAHENNNNEVKLRREIGVFSGVCLVVSTMIGSGIFIVPTAVLKYSNSDVIMCLISWTCGGVITLVLALCICELGTTFQDSGSYLAYLQRLYGPLFGFIYAWLFVGLIGPEGQAAQMIAFGEYVLKLYFTNNGDCYYLNKEFVAKIIGLLITLLVLYINIIHVKAAIKLQVFCALGKVTALLIIVGAGIIHFIRNPETGRNNFMSSALVKEDGMGLKFFTIGEVSFAIYESLWAFDGAEAITIITEEVKNPQKTLPRVTVLSVIIVTVLYVLVNISYFAVLTPSDMLASNAVAVSFGEKIHPILPMIMTLSVCLSLIGSLNGLFLISGRMPYVASKFGHMPKIFSMIHIEYLSPMPALLFMMMMVSIMLSSSGIDDLITANLLLLWSFRCICLFGLLKLRRQKHLKQPYKVSMVTVLLAIVMSSYVTLIPLLFQPEALYLLSLVALVVLCLAYFLLTKMKRRLICYERFSIFMQKLLVVSPTNASSACG